MTAVVATRDRPRLVVDAVDSVLAQSVADVEVIVVDDGSVEALRLPGHPRVTVIRRPVPGGPAAARNRGVELASGRWLVFVDDDDVALPSLVERSLTAMEGCDLPPPSRPRGGHFSLEPLEPGRSYLSKQTWWSRPACCGGRAAGRSGCGPG